MNVSISPLHDPGLWPKQEIPIDQPVPLPLPDNTGGEIPVPDDDEPPPLEEIIPHPEASE